MDGKIYSIERYIPVISSGKMESSTSRSSICSSRPIFPSYVDTVVTCNHARNLPKSIEKSLQNKLDLCAALRQIR